MYNKDMKHSSRDLEKGSALFLILIGVALFAALGYAVSSMMQGGTNVSINKEQSQLYANEILDYGRNIRQAVQAMRISNGCRDTQISFENPIEGGYVNGTDTACQVFSPDGGALSYITPSEKWLEASNSSADLYGELYFTGDACVNGVGTSNTGTACRDLTSNYAELILFIPYIKESICLQIADAMNILNTDQIPTEFQRAWPDANPKFTGVFTSSNVIANNNGSDTSETLDGATQGCFEGGGTNPAADTYHFYQVLIAR